MHMLRSWWRGDGHAGLGEGHVKVTGVVYSSLAEIVVMEMMRLAR